jgi:NAD-dependent SIR2 family protein deacetylase
MQSGMSTWHQDQNPLGTVVELHGNARFLLCPHCHQVFEVKNADLIHMKRCRPKMCSVCHRGHLRFKIMLYDDEEASLITPEDVWTRLEDDLQVADLVVWVGISFEQVCPFPVLRLACCDACACLAVCLVEVTTCSQAMHIFNMLFCACRARRLSTSARRALS